MESAAVRQALIDACPELEPAFRRNDEDETRVGLEYLEMGMVASYLGECLRDGGTSWFPAAFAGVERCLQEGDDAAITLVVVGLLEDLQNSGLTGIKDPVMWHPFLLPETRRAWDEVEAFWEGRSG